MSDRPRITFRPRWTPELNGYSIRIIRGFYKSLSADHDFEDLLQEAYIVYMRCATHYGKVVDNDKWFMALFKTALHNHLCNLCRDPGVTFVSLDEVDPNDLSIADCAIEMFEVLESVPEELRFVVNDLARPVARLLKSNVSKRRFGDELRLHLATN